MKITNEQLNELLDSLKSDKLALETKLKSMNNTKTQFVEDYLPSNKS